MITRLSEIAKNKTLIIIYNLKYSNIVEINNFVSHVLSQ